MNLLHDFQKAAKKKVPMAKELMNEVGRTAKGVGETIIEDQTAQKAASAAGKAIRSAGGALTEKHKERRIEKDTCTFADLKAKYPGGVILHVKPYFSHKAKQFRKLGVDISPFEERKVAFVVFDEQKHLKYKIYGNFSGMKRVFSLRNMAGRRLATVVEHDHQFRETYESLYIDRSHCFDINEHRKFSDPRFLFEKNLKTTNQKRSLYFEGQPFMDVSSVKGFQLLSFADPEREILSLLIYIAFALLDCPVIHGGGG